MPYGLLEASRFGRFFGGGEGIQDNAMREISITELWLPAA
jgi:hypothetical protein